MRRAKSGREGYGLFLPEGSSIWYWRRQYKGRKLGGSTGETRRARSFQVAKEQYKAAVRQVDAEIVSGRKPMTLGRANELYVSEIASGLPFETLAARELAWIETVLGRDMFLHDITQQEVTEVRNERRLVTTKRGAGKDPQGRPLAKLVAHSTVNRTMQTFRAALYHVRNKHEAFVKPNLNFGITKEEVTKREVSEAEESVLIEALREDFHDIFVFALLSGIAGGGLCAQMTFRSKRHRGDPPGFIRWETQALGPVEVALLAEILAAKHHPKYVFTYVSQGKKGRDRQERRLRGGQLPDHARDADDPLAARRVTERFLTQASLRVLRSGREPKLPRKSCHLMSATEGGLTQHQHHHCAHIASLALQKLQGKLQGRPNLKVVG